MPRCPECDELVAADDSKCPSCGSVLKAAGQGKKPAVTVAFVLVCVLGFCCLGSGVIGVAVGLPAVQQARNAARMAQSKNNLKSVGIALHNYHEVFRALPPGGVYSPEGEPRQAWMTALLPYVEQGALYTTINPDLPYTNPANRTPFTVVVKDYVQPAVTPLNDPQGFGLAHYAGNVEVFGTRNRSLRIHEFHDGLSNTMFAGEVADGFVPWGSTENVRDLSAGIGVSATQFGSSVPARVQLLMGDGAVRVISAEINLKILKAIGTPNGNDDVSNVE